MSTLNPSHPAWPADVERLALWRHAHAVDIAPDDESRSLTARGRSVAARAGAALAPYGPFDVALVSTAARCAETMEHAGRDLTSAVAQVRFCDALYLAHPDEIVALIAAAGGRRVCVVGHNPGLRDLCAAFGGPDVKRLRKGAAYVFDCGRSGARLSGFVDLA